MIGSNPKFKATKLGVKTESTFVKYFALRSTHFATYYGKFPKNFTPAPTNDQFFSFSILPN
jgi:hypothetical protein